MEKICGGGEQPRPLRLLPLVASTSPKVGGFGNPRKVSGFARGSPFEERLPPVRGKMSRSDKKGNLASECETERVSQLKQKPPLIFANQKWSDVHYKVSSSCGSWARSSMTWGHTASSRLRD